VRPAVVMKNCLKRRRRRRTIIGTPVSILGGPQSGFYGTGADTKYCKD